MEPVIVVMGVCGAGKSTVGEALARHLGAKFVDADSLHPQANVNKMAAGSPLTDEDRWPWLGLVGAELAATHPDGIIVACSALKRAYRDAIRAKAPATIFVQLDVELSLLLTRLNQRPGHFMPPSLLDSQLETLQPLELDEAGITVTTSEGIDETVNRILPLLGHRHEVLQNS
ncbi:gluconate kinase (SKI family) [Arthrobacter sp. SLBN-100]|uniref:gluconokinase n=1 Tax=Arthrobacter sp. SLBN-100 TaxID=2768450 RepID=UPI001152FAFE|nr:gluconokinase [Arthrobacter sp. SLBN-100]TQJ68823.1 gluconate kinase (SKI family) [Arthrobacter sp. SLBN-100]